MFLNSRRRLHISFSGLLFFSALSMNGQDSLKVVNLEFQPMLTQPMPTYNKMLLRRYEHKLDSLKHRMRKTAYPVPDALNNPYYFPLMGGTTLYSAALRNKMGFTSLNARKQAPASGLASSRQIYEVISATDTYLMGAYAETPWYVRYNEEKEGTLNVDEEIRESVKPETTLTEHFTEGFNPNDIDVLEGEDLGIVVRKPNFWTFKTNFAFQFTQNFVTDNWYKGGESHNAMLASTLIEANYDNKRKLTFDNRLEMKLGFQTSHDDSRHKFKTNSDLLRLTNKLGFCAIKDWYYTIMLQSWTQFCRGYKPNDPKVYSDFMAPYVSLLSLGMDYKKHSKNNKFNITATISPIALKFQYVKRPELVKDFGHDDNHKVKWEYGSNITVTHSWNICKNVSWSGRFYFFSDYSKAQIEWENTFNFTITKYLSTRLFLYPRFDDAIPRKEDQSYFQFNELLSLGLNFNF